MKAIEKRLDLAERKADPPEGITIMLAEDLGGGRYRCTSDGTVYEPGTLPRGAVLILREEIVEAGP